MTKMIKISSFLDIYQENTKGNNILLTNLKRNIVKTNFFEKKLKEALLRRIDYILVNIKNPYSFEMREQYIHDIVSFFMEMELNENRKEVSL